MSKEMKHITVLPDDFEELKTKKFLVIPHERGYISKQRRQGKFWQYALYGDKRGKSYYFDA